MYCSVPVLVVAGTWLYAGPLNPPAGPITSTGKTLSEVEARIAVNATNTPGDNDATPSVYKITQPGSYYLTGNISLVNAKNAIEITASGVTLDLNGFTIAGFGGHVGVVVTNSAVSRIVIRNGSVVNFLQGGIEADVAGVEIDHISVETCGVLGIRTGDHAIITDCSATDCHTNAIGILTGIGSVLTRCIASGNAHFGIIASHASTFSNCSAISNGDIGIYTGVNCTLSNCLAFQNAVGGILTSNACTVSNCSAFSNGGNGIGTHDGSTVSNCSAYSNTGSGVVTNFSCTVFNCSTYSNDVVGIDAAYGTNVEGCVTQFNSLDGIRCTTSCTIRGNTCTDDGANAGDGAGIHALNDNNRIEGNNCIDADRGIDVDGAGNIIIKNTCSGNTVNWTIVAGNSFLIVQANVTSSNFSGNAGGGGQGSTDPNANFTY